MEKRENIFDCAPFFFRMDQEQEGLEEHSFSQNPEVPMRKSFDTCSVEVFGVSLTWKDISVFIPKDKEEFLTSWLSKRKKVHSVGQYKRVLNNISGVARPGTLLAIMGASGAGKTTLLNALALRLPQSVIADGEVAVNGHVLGQKHFHHMAGFVHQNDYFYGSLTVREHLTMMAKLRLDKLFTNDQINQRINEIIQQTGLRKCESSRIGTPGMNKRLSGGERKRLAFASEILADPPLIFCDEPTSGLDYFMAQTVVGVLENMAAKGKTILCSIHQPSSEVFSMFTELLLLAEGRVAFQGPVREAQDFFDSMGYVCPPMFNPSDFYIHTLAVTPGKEKESLTIIKTICEKYASSKYSTRVDDKIERVMTSNNEVGLESYRVYDKTKYQTSWITHLRLLLWRGMVHSLRQKNATITRTLQKLLIGIALALMYTNVSWNEMSAMDVMGVVFLFITENTYSSMYSVIQLFQTEVPIFLREYTNGLYRAETFYFSKILTLIPAFIVEPLMFVLITYWVIGLNSNPVSFLLTVLIVILLTNTAGACGCLFSAMSKDIPTAMLSIVPFDYIMMIMGGLFIHIKTIPWYISWTQYLSWFRYSNEALNIAQWYTVTNITCNGNQDIPCYNNGKEVLQNYGFDSANLSTCIIALILLYVGFHILGCLALWHKARKSCMP